MTPVCCTTIDIRPPGPTDIRRFPAGLYSDVSVDAPPSPASLPPIIGRIASSHICWSLCDSGHITQLRLAVITVNASS